ncbi:MAG: alpha/beta hydrolase [Pseudomonadales bacterium]
MLTASVMLGPVAVASQAPVFSSCALAGNGGATRANAQCAIAAVPLNHDDPDGAQIELHIARIRSLAPDPAADAFTVINGGPGGSSLSLYADLAPVFASILRERDIVVVDQRGTGRSTPLTCPELEDSPTVSDPQLIAGFARQCVASLEHDPRYFTTSVAVRDLELIRAQLGYAQLTIYGVSYGTRVAQHYARRYPEQTRALIIDGVLPVTAALGPQIAIKAQDTLDSIMARCADDADCNQALPALPQQLAALRAELTKAPVALQLPDPVTGTNTPMDFDYGHLAIALRLLAYAPETASLIPLLIHEAASNRNYLPLASQALRVTTQLSDSMSYGMHNAVVCTEDVPYYDFDMTQMRARLQQTYLGSEQMDALIAICSEWPAGVIDPEFKTPLAHNIPTLLLSGQFDPITPPSYAEVAADPLGNARAIVAPGQGHGVIMRGCIPRLVDGFIESLDSAAVDSSCVEQLGNEAFFIDLLGPAR